MQTKLDERCAEVRNLREILSDQEDQLLNLRNSLNDKSKKIREIGITSARETQEKEQLLGQLSKKDETIKEKEERKEFLSGELNAEQKKNAELMKELKEAQEHENNM